MKIRLRIPHQGNHRFINTGMEVYYEGFVPEMPQIKGTETLLRRNRELINAARCRCLS